MKWKLGRWGTGRWGTQKEGDMPEPYLDRTAADALLADLFLTEDRQVWLESTTGDRDTALSQATRDIDSLAYAGQKNDSAQPRKFPRGSDITTPDEILEACVLIAVARLDGKRPEEEVESQGLSSVSYSSVRSTYDRSSVQEHTSAGIVSFEAWRILRKYLRDPSTFQIRKA